MYKIVIIGCGQIGSRHLQGLLKSEFPISIDVVDPNESSLNIAKSRAEEIETKFSDVRYLKQISELDDSIDLCFVATNSNIRFKVLYELLTTKIVKNVVLEKVLFQSLEEYNHASDLLSRNGVNCWVNCPRRMFDIYKELQLKIEKNAGVTYIVSGGEWGLACNAIHFIDNMAFLTQKNDFEFDHSGITEIIDSKRLGFVEFYGTLILRQKNGSELILCSQLGSNASVKVRILTGNYSWGLDEGAGKLIESGKSNNWKEQIRDIEIPFQSDLSNRIASQILLSGGCDLTSFQDSKILHQDMIRSFINVYNLKMKLNVKSCPIT